jgi:hypothetical protein
MAATGVATHEVDVIALPGLTWADVAQMPAVQQLMARGAVGSLTAKAAGTGTRCLSGSLSFSAGNRAEPTAAGCVLPTGGWAVLRASNLTSSYAADVGALGTALTAAGIGTNATSPAAQPLLAQRDGSVGPAVAGSGRRVVASLDTALSVAVPDRRDGEAVADRFVGTALAGLPPDATVMLTATADGASGGPSLHPLIIAGPGWAHRELSFPSGRAPYADIVDLAPTILRAFAVPIPATMVGKPLQVTSSPVRSVSAYLDQDSHAHADSSVQARFLLTLGWLTILVVVLVALGRREGRVVARLLAGAPLLSFLVNLLPWWRWDRWLYAAALAVGCGLLALATTLLARRRPVVAVLAVPVASLVALVADQLAGAPMQLSSPLGYDPLSAGRFVGVGNLDFAVLAAAAVVVASLAGARLPRRAGLLVAAAVMLLVLIVDVAPPLGDDAGGLLALPPTAVVVLAVLAGVRLSVRRIAAVVAVTVGLAVAVALADYSRPTSSQTHIGAFVGQLLHGGAGTEVGRKAHAALATVGFTVSTAVVVACLLAAVLCRERLRVSLGADAGLLALVAGGLTAAVIGSALNDSGLSIAAVGAAVAVSAACGVQWPMRAPTRQDASIRAAADTTTKATARTDSPESPGR